VTSTEYARASELRARRKAQRRKSRNRILVAVAVVVAFGVGIALGQALHDNPKPGLETSVTTLPPIAPATTP
jgi:hypothetical protein